LSLRKKTLLTMIAAMVCLIVLLFIISGVVLLSGYENLEKQEVAEDVRRVEAALDEKLVGMKGVAGDWAAWDETYTFMIDPNEAYIASNLAPASFESLGLNYILCYDNGGSLVYGQGYDLETGEQAAVPPDLESISSASLALLAADGGGSGAVGLLRLPRGVLMVASQPILTSERQGPSRGTLVMARYLDEQEIASLSRLTQLSIDFERPGDEEMLAGFRQAATHLAAGEAVYIDPLDKNWVAGYSFLDDLDGNPVLILQVQTNRDIYRQGRTTLFTLSWLVLAAALFFGGLIILLFESMVLRRLSRLNTDIGEITRSEDPSMRLPLRGKDEISQQAYAINLMLERLESSRHDLSESEGRYRELVDKAQDVIYTLSEQDGNITSLNPAFAELTGWPVEEWIGKSFAPLIHPDDLERALLAYEETRQNRVPPPQEFRVISHRGDYLTLEFIITPLVRHGRVEGTFGIARDVTRRRLTRERLEKLNRCFISLGANPRENILRIIDAGLDVLGGDLMKYRRFEEGGSAVSSTNPAMEGPDGSRPPASHVFYDVLIMNGAKELSVLEVGEVELATEDPDIISYSLKSSLGYPVSLEGQSVGDLRLFSRDRKEFDAEEVEIMGILARAISMEEERREYQENLRDFIDIASHELRHPVTVMKGYAITLIRGGFDLDDETGRDILQAISAGADRLDRLVSQLLDIARIERGKFPVEIGPVEAGPLAERAVQEIRERGFHHRFTLRARGEVSYVQADPERLVELLVILLENAAKFSPADTEIEIEFAELGSQVLVSVQDRGSGVPSADQEAIFTRFYQVEAAMHHSTPGIGIGLFIARQIVEAQGGRIWYEPRPGGGSIFRFTLNA
jgi:PAS domain S-box-containing protein